MSAFQFSTARALITGCGKENGTGAAFARRLASAGIAVEEGVAHLVDDAVARYGRLDIQVNNAGAPHGQDRGEIETRPSMPGTR